MFYGLCRFEAWERYFLNERKYGTPNRQEIEMAMTRPFGHDIETEHGRRDFESTMNRMISDYPGMFVPEGEKFDFKAFYAA